VAKKTPVSDPASVGTPARFGDLANELIARGLLDSVQGEGRAVSEMLYSPGPPETAIPTFSATATAADRDAVNALIASWIWGEHRPRKLHDIWQAINALSAAQQANVWNWLVSGTPPVWTQHQGTNDAAMLAVHFTATLTGLTTAQLNDARRRLVAMMVEDRPLLLVNPTFDPTISVPGQEPV
jgi:hypothetical protein